ncbi:AIPR family protein [bacterium]|nr:AIPR family protein [bacterium]
MTKKSIFRDKLADFVREQVGKTMSELPDKQKSYWMTRYYVTAILAQIQPELVPDDDEINVCHVDDAGDLGADFISKVDNRVLIIQAKSRGTKNPAEDPEAFDSFCEVLNRLKRADEGLLKTNSRVREALSLIDWDSDTFDLHFVTLGRANAPIRERESRGIESSQIIDAFDRSEVCFLDENDLNEKLREAESLIGDSRPSINLYFHTDKGKKDTPWLVHTDELGRRCFVGIVEARQISEVFKPNRLKLFSLNIRSYLGDNRTNKKIAETAIEDNVGFFFYNNGIAAVATQILDEPDKRLLQCREFSVINGAQTVRSLAKAVKRNGIAADALVLVRVTEVSVRRNVDDRDFLDKVTRYNNTQNPVKIADFRSTDPIQLHLARRFERVSRKGKKYWYQNKRDKDARQNKIVIKLDTFARTIHAFRFGPIDMFGGPSYLYDTDNGKGYCKVFGDSVQTCETLTDAEFEVLSGTWFICEEIEEFYSNYRGELVVEEEKRIAKEPEAEPYGVRDALTKWLVYYTAGEMLRQRYAETGRDFSADLGNYCSPSWMDEDSSKREIVREYTKSACEVLLDVFAAERKKPGFAVRRWTRNADSLSEIRNSRALLRESRRLPLLKK